MSIISKIIGGGGGSGLSEAQVDARVVAVASGIEHTYFDVSKDDIFEVTCAARATGGSSVNSYKHLAFDGTTAEQAIAYWKPPKRWNAGTIRARFVLKKPSGTGTEGTRWGIQAVAISPGDDFGVSLGTGVGVTLATTADAKDVLISDWTPACTIGNSPAKGDLVKISPSRNPAHADDTLNGVDMEMLGMEIEWTSDAPTDD